MATSCGVLEIKIALDGETCDGCSCFSWAAGGRVLTISTVLPAQGLAVELVSSYVGHSRTGTIVTHLLLGPGCEPATIRSSRDSDEQLDPVGRPRGCVYDHAQRLIEALRVSGLDASVHLSEDTFLELEELG